MCVQGKGGLKGCTLGREWDVPSVPRVEGANGTYHSFEEDWEEPFSHTTQGELRHTILRRCRVYHRELRGCWNVP